MAENTDNTQANNTTKADDTLAAPEQAPGGTRPKNDGLNVKDVDETKPPVKRQSATPAKPKSKRTSAKAVEKAAEKGELEDQYYASDLFTVNAVKATTGAVRTNVEVAPVGWVGPAPLIIDAEHLTDLKELLGKIH